MAKDNYITGQQDAWIEALREEMKEVKDLLQKLFDKTDVLSAKINRVYGGAVALGAVAGFLGAAILLFLQRGA